MNLAQVIKDILNPGLAQLPLAMDSTKARWLMLTTGLQESKFEHRFQVLNGGGKGAARSFWQCEEGGAVKGVMTHHATGAHLHRICDERGVAWERRAVWNAIENDDLLACALARLNYWWTPGSLPEVGDYEGSWRLYCDVAWRPGKPHRETWNGYCDDAREALGV